MTWTKREIITQAFEELGLAAYAFDLKPEEMQSAMVKLDTMMADWTARGIVFDPVYPNPAGPTDGDLDDETNAPIDANAPMFNNLALLLGPPFGKTPRPETMKMAASGFSLLMGKVVVPAIQMTGMIRGAGNKHPLYPFIEPVAEEDQA